MYRLSQIKLSLNENKDDIPKKIAKKINVSLNDISQVTLIKESIDARDNNNIFLVYTADFHCSKRLNLKATKNLTMAEPRVYIRPKQVLNKDERPVVMGFGPSGIFAALILAQEGYRPIVLERGKDVDQRSDDVEKFWATGILNTESNVQFGEGGAGTFSDGKLTTGIKDKRIFKVLTELYNHGAKEDILYKQKPHIGTDKLKNIIKNIRLTIEELGGEVRFSHKAISPVFSSKYSKGKSHIIGLNVSSPQGEYLLKCSKAVFAIGHSARDTFENFYNNGLILEQKPISIGLRVEHPQKIIDESQYGNSSLAEKLGPAEYKLSHRLENGRGVYTFCMCPGGVVIMSSSDEKTVVSNGMSYSLRDGKFANSALLVDVKTDDYGSEHPLAGFNFQQHYERKAYMVNENYNLLECKWIDFQNSQLYKVLPSFASQGIVEGMKAFGNKIKGFDGDNAVFKGIETRSSSPVRAPRDESYQSNIGGLYPCGEGPGFAGGIMSAAVDGIKVAESIIENR